MKNTFIFLFALAMLLPSTSSAQNEIEYETFWNTYGTYNLDNLSRTVRLPGDLTGDSVPDILLGSYSADSATKSNVGILKVIDGATGTEHFSVYGPFSFDILFSPDVLPGDLNNDGVPDILGTSSSADSSEGASDNVGIVMAINGADGTTLWTQRGDYATDYLTNGGLFAADLNGDGVNDIITSGSTADTSFGANDNKGLVRAFNGTNGDILFSVYGNFSEDKMYIGNVGDVTGDGVTDILAKTIIGDTSEGEGSAYGYVKVINGATGGTHFTTYGIYEGDQFGDNVFVLGDTLGSTHHEVVVGSPLGDSSSAVNDTIGHVAILNGQTGAIEHDFRGVCAGDKYGDQIFPTSDLNGDSKPDFIMSSPEVDTAPACAGDNKGLIMAVNGVTGTPLYTMRGDFSQDRLGEQILLEDITGDSIPDIIAAVYDADSAEGANDNVGLIRAYHGVTGAVLFSSYGSFSQDHLGEQFFTISDLNGDNHKDIIATSGLADSAEGANDNVGLVRAINGLSGDTLFEVRGDSAGDALGALTIFGTAVETPDFNLDGVADLLVSAREAHNPDELGSTQGVVKLISGADGHTLFTVYGDFSGDRLADSMWLPGDLNGDNSDNILLCTGAGDTASGANDNTGSCKALTLEQCPGDPDKTGPGVCGCGIPDTDSDGDGLANCVDLCQADPNKTAPGICGCGVADEDIDSDGITDCNDDFIGTDGGGDTSDDGGSDDNVVSQEEILMADLEIIQSNVQPLYKKKGRKARIQAIKDAQARLLEQDLSSVSLTDVTFDLSSKVTKVRKLSKKAIKFSKKRDKPKFKKMRKKVKKFIAQILAALS